MKLFRFGTSGREKPAVELDDGTRLDLSGHVVDYTPEFFAAGGMERVAGLIAEKADCPRVDPGERIGPPVARPHKFMAIGLNYSKHAAEVGAEPPKEPMAFNKLTSCICGPYDDIVMPKGCTKLDYEVELAFVMKTRCQYAESEEAAMTHVAGFTICNDVSERAFQAERGGQFFKGKSSDTFGPLGPYLVPTKDVDYGNLPVQTKVNGEVRQESNTNDLIFAIPHIVWYLSQFFPLEPGDVVTTGTPEGVIMGMEGQPWLKPGDVVELSAGNLGAQRLTVRSL